ncbi:MAG TPA: amidohydrolase [Opitutae bacterium]|nr:amidohydrolase [Opitutae bacterium]|tara:strand:- start:679 stop:1560 length:882 start_codon:yes stop_codon:yes gene_type:complete
MKVALLQYQPKTFTCWKDFTHGYAQRLKTARDAGAELVCFAEYSGLELLSLFSGGLKAQLKELQALMDDYIEFFQAQANELGVYIQPGTLLEARDAGRYRNRAYFFAPQCEKLLFQDKLQLTAYEKAVRIVEPGNALCVFKTKAATFGINICYDVEFPLYALKMAHHGADVLIVPSCTDTRQGFHRVHTCARARAIENQLFVLNTCTVGACDRCDFIDVNIGASAIMGPVEEADSVDYTIGMAPFNEDAELLRELDFAYMKRYRERGAVRNFKDHQILMDGLAGMPVKVHTLE